MKKLIAALAAATALLGLSGCADPDASSRRALEGMGMTDVQTSYSWFQVGCSKSDDWGRNFTAKGPTGVPVSGTVCGGYFLKGATVRFD